MKTTPTATHHEKYSQDEKLAIVSAITNEKPLRALNVYDEQTTEAKTDDYPYGFLRCSAKWWIETSKTGRINAPKKSTYGLVKVIYKDPATGHYEVGGVHQYDSAEEIEKFLNTFENIRSSDLAILGKQLRMQKFIDAKFASGELKWVIKTTEMQSVGSM